MTLALAFCLLLLTLPVAGGRLSRLEEVRIRWVWLVVVAFAIQVVLVTIVPEPRFNALMVQATPQQLDMIEQLLEVIDQESSPRLV